MQKTDFKISKLAEKSTLAGLFKLLAAFLAGAAQVGNMRPFGISFAAASRGDELWRFAGAFLGSLLVGGGDGGILYAAAIMICFACRMVLKDTKMGKNRAFLPLCSGLSVIIIKAAGLLSGFSLRNIVLLIFEGALCISTALLFSLTKEDKPDNVHLAGTALALIAALFAFEPLRLLGLISLARLAACLSVLCVGFFYGSGAGAGVGVVLGALFDMAVFSRPHIAFIYGLGGLLCGGGKTAPRALRSAMWMVGCLSALIWCGKTAESSAIATECIISGAAIMFMPRKPWSKIETRLSRKATAAAGEIKPELSVAIEALGEEIASLPKRRGGNELQKVLDRAADGVCTSCAEARECWREDYVATGAALMSVGAAAKEKSEISAGDFPRPFAQKCIKLDKLCKEINRQLIASRSRQGAAKRKEENAALMKRQYEGISTLFKDVSGSKEQGGEATLSAIVDTLSQSRSGESVCGDSLCHFVTDDKRQIVLLSDGMGSGARAGRASQRAVTMLRQLISAGAGISAAVQAVTPVLEAKFEVMGFVTLDLLQLDLKNGEAIFVKYGASPSYIIRDGREQKLWRQSLPAGLGGEGAMVRVNLKAGDKVIMVSDGVTIPENLEGSGETLCRRLILGKAEDDKTAAVITIGEV